MFGVIMIKRVDQWLVHKAELLVEYVEDYTGIGKNQLCFNLTIAFCTFTPCGELMYHDYVYVAFVSPLFIFLLAFAYTRLIYAEGVKEDNLNLRLIWALLCVLDVIQLYIKYKTLGIFMPFIFFLIANLSMLVRDYIEAGEGNTGKRKKVEKKTEVLTWECSTG